MIRNGIGKNLYKIALFSMVIIGVKFKYTDSYCEQKMRLKSF